MKPVIISAFPGIGKTYAVQNSNMNLIDSDSSKFSWIYDENGNKTNTRNPEFPQNYIDNIKNLLNNKSIDCIFISSHEDVKKALDENNIDFISVYPNKDNKESHIKRLKERLTGLNNDKFISIIESNWDNWIPDNRDSEYKKYKNCINVLWLGTNTYMTDICDWIKINYLNKGE